MGLAFSLPKDKKVRDSKLFQSFALVTLLDILRIRAEDFTIICTILARISGIYDGIKIKDPDRNIVKKPDVENLVRDLCKCAARMKLPVVKDRAEELLAYLTERDEIEIAVLDRLMTPLPEKLIIELKQEHWLRVRPEYATLYSGKKAFLSSQVVREMPEIQSEAKEARRCFALQKYTASAFHLMRIMELLVQRFAGKFGITPNPDIDTWGTILNQTRQEIEKWENNRSHPNRPHRKKYNECYKSIDSLRPHRNDLMHSRQTYNEGTARDLKGAVELAIRTFLKLPTLVAIP